MRKIVIAVLAGLIFCGPAFGWGHEGHATVAKIAERHLKPSAKKKIEKYLDGKSIVYYAKWMDEYRTSKEYGFTTSWHVNQVDENLNYVARKNGDALYGLNLAIDALQNYKELPDSAVAVNIKYILHLVGDMHCPAHIYYKTNSQKYRVKVHKGASSDMAAHSAWDYGIIQHMRIYSPYEWANELDRVSKDEEKAIVEGGPADWLRESAENCKIQFDLVRPGDFMTPDDLNTSIYLIEDQILKAGLRLAKVLNDLF